MALAAPLEYRPRHTAGRTMNDAPAPFTALPNAILDDPDLDLYDCSVYTAILRRDHHGEGWVFELPELAEAARCGVSRLQKCLRKLEQRGLIHRAGKARRTARYFALRPSQLAPHANCDDGQLAPHAIRLAPGTDSVGTTCHPYKEEQRQDKDYQIGVVQEAPLELSVRADAPPATKASEKARSPKKAAAEKEDAVPPTGADRLVDEFRAALGCETFAPGTRKRFAALFRRLLSSHTADERSRFLGWFVSNGYWSKDTLYLLKDKGMEQEYEAWIAGEMPRTKVAAQKQKPRASGDAAIAYRPDLLDPAAAEVEARIQADITRRKELNRAAAEQGLRL